jgi:hypothetical protein
MRALLQSRRLARNLRPCFHEPAPPRPRRPAPSRVTLKSKKSCSLAEKQPFRGDVRCLTMVPPCRGQFETGSRRATFIRRPQWLVFSSSRGDRNRFLAAPAQSPAVTFGADCFHSGSPHFENLSENKLATSGERRDRRNCPRGAKNAPWDSFVSPSHSR